MPDQYQRIAEMIKRRPTDVWGLSCFPDLEPEISNDQDHPLEWINTEEVTDCNLRVVRDVVLGMGDRCQAIMEIGVNRNGLRSMSRVLMDERPRGSFYLGVDLDDKSYLDDHDRNTWTLRCNSHDQDAIRGFLRGRGVAQLDLLFIDGWHSVNTCVNDWRYADMLRPGGVVMLHDTNSHPGCVALFEAVDHGLFSKERHCLGDDFGIAVFRRRQDV